MKYYETHYTEYLKSAKSLDFHPELEEVRAAMPKTIHQLKHMILYGPSGAGKYTQLLRLITPYSRTQLKYEKKISVQTDKHTYFYRISDIHYEIDISLLGCESKRVWNECFFQIVDIVSINPDKAGIIVCKNFHAIHSELLDVFYSYMQHCNTISIHLTFFILTDHVSFIPDNIVKSSKLVRIKRPDQVFYETQTSPLFSEIGTDSILNLKEMRYLPLVKNAEQLPKDVFNIVCDTLIQEMMNPDKIVFVEFRDQLYDILLYGLDITDCLWYILNHFVEVDMISNVDLILAKIHTFLKYYNNNYRPIYHLESIFFYMITQIHRK
jgi:hypothetical protein